MSDLERLTLDEALAWYAKATPWHNEHSDSMAAAARAYRDLLANGERVWVCQHNRGGERLCREVNAYDPSLHATCGWKLLVDPPTEEES